MEWVLVFVNVIALTPQSAWYGTFDDMNECFLERETIMEQIGDPIGYNMICIPRSVKDPLLNW